MTLLFLACTSPQGGQTTPIVPTGPSETGDTASPQDTAPLAAAPEASEISWQVHEEIGAILVVGWQQDAEAVGHIEFSAGGDWQTSPATDRAAGAHQELILGVPYGAEVTFRVVLSSDSGTTTSEDVLAQTDPLPEGLPAPELLVAEQDGADPDARWLLLAAFEGEDEQQRSWKLIIDRSGRIVWAHETTADSTSNLQPSRDGAAFLWETNNESRVRVVHRMTIDGTITETVEIPGMHHAFIEVADGSMAWVARDGPRDIVRENTADGGHREIWDCSAYWQEHNASVDCDGNGIFWNEDDDTLYYSSDNETTVVELDRATGEPLRVWGGLENAWGFTEGSGGFHKQHSPVRTPEGHLMVSTWLSADDMELVVREYAIDDDSQMLDQVWTCGEGSGIEASHGGETHRLSGGNTTINYGPGGHFREYTPGCEVVWEFRWGESPHLRRGTFLADLYAYAP